MQTSTTRFSKAARTPEIIWCTAPKWRGYDGSKVNIIKLGKHWTCFNKIYSAQLTRSRSFRPWKRCHFLLPLDQGLTTWKWRRVTKEICRWNRPRAQCYLHPYQWSATCTVGGRLESVVTVTFRQEKSRWKKLKGLSSRKSTVKFFLWAAFMTLSKAIVGKLSLGPKRPTIYLNNSLGSRFAKNYIDIKLSNRNDDCRKYWAKPLNCGQILSSGYFGRSLNLEKPQLHLVWENSPEKFKQSSFPIYHQSRTVLVLHSFFISFMSCF